MPTATARYPDLAQELLQRVAEQEEELERVVARRSGSTSAAAAIGNEIKVRTVARRLLRGAMPPVITSASVVGAEASRRLFDAAYAEDARRAARALAGSWVMRVGTSIDGGGGCTT